MDVIVLKPEGQAPVKGGYVVGEVTCHANDVGAGDDAVAVGCYHALARARLSDDVHHLGSGQPTSPFWRLDVLREARHSAVSYFRQSRHLAWQQRTLWREPRIGRVSVCRRLG
jgi:hypothetical protein